MDLLEREPNDPDHAASKKPLAPETEGIGQFFLKDFTKLPAVKTLTGPQVAWDDSDLITLIREELMDTRRPTLSKLSYPLFETPQAKAVDKILNEKVRYLPGEATNFESVSWRANLATFSSRQYLYMNECSVLSLLHLVLSYYM